MKIIQFFTISITICLFAFNLQAADLKVDVDLSPAGDFVAKTSSVKGKAFSMKKNGKDVFVAKGIEVDLRTITTGIKVRDKHLKEYLEVKKYPTAKLIKAKGSDGKGMALIDIKGKKLKVNGTFEVKANTLNANFPIKLTQLGITGVRYMGVGVKDELKVQISVPVVPYASMRAPASTGK